ALSSALRKNSPQSPDQLLSAPRRQQRRLGQHRHFRLARLSDADQSRFSLPRFDSGGTNRAGPGDLLGFGTARRIPWNSGMAELLFQIADDGCGIVSRARSLHSIHEAEKHFALDDGRRTDHPPWAGILRLSGLLMLAEVNRNFNGGFVVRWRILPLFHSACR